MGQKSPSPGPKSNDMSYFNSFLHSQSIPRTLDLNTPPMMTAGLRNSQHAEDMVTNMVKSNFAARGRVRSMVSAIEKGERGRANTLPAGLPGIVSSPPKPILSAGSSPIAVTGRRVQSSHLDNWTGPRSHPERGEHTSVIPTASLIKGQQQTSGILKQPLTQPRKLSTTLETSVEESVSYVKLHPPSIENSDTVLPEEEGEREEEREKGVSRTEEVFVSLVQDDDHEVRKGSCNGVDVLGLEKADSSSSILGDTSDELDQPLAEGGQNDSLINLYQEEELGSPQLGGKKKKRRWKKLFRKRKSVEEKEGTKPERSQSDAPLKSGGVGFEVKPSGVTLRPKMRSISADMLMDTGLGDRKKIDRYTIYMQDYTAKLEEQRKLSPSREGLTTSQGSGQEEVDRGSTEDVMERGGDATPPAEMTPLTFKQSLFCNQLKYKLRSALQNIHIPLTLNPTLNSAYQQLHLKDGLELDARYQLILLIQHALQRTQWMQDDMETALLTEVLRMVEPLPSSL